jgi:hypothetical protein
MRILRSGVAWAFLFTAAIYLWLTVLVIRLPVSVHRHYHSPPLVHRSPIFGVFFGLAVLFAFAGWTVLKKKPSARVWGLGASIVALLPLVAFVSDPFYLHHYSAWILCAPGVAGLIAFARPWTEAQANGNARPPSPIPGDGTNKVINALVWVAGIVAGFESIKPWYRWAAAHRLPPAHHWLSLSQLAVVILAIVVIHEGGHALTGLALDMKLTAVVLGPFHWWVSYGKWRFAPRWAGLFTFLGAVALLPTKMENYRRRKILMVFGGPAANIVTGLLAMLAVLTAPGHAWAGSWILLVYFATDSLLIGLLNLVPFGAGGRYSDGAKLYQLLSQGAWREYHWLMGMMGSATVSALRPMEYDIAMIRRVRGTAARGHDELLMYLAEYAYFLDRNELGEAGLAIEKADRFCVESAFNPPAEWCGVLVFGNAFLRRDARAARQWWERLEAGKAKNEARWISLSALLWSENRLGEASAAWQKAAKWTEQLPQAGMWEAERNALNLLRRALDAPAPPVATETVALSPQWTGDLSCGATA